MEPAESTDAIVRRVRRGETEAFAEIVRRHQRDVWRVIAAMLQSIEESQELMQQAFIDAYMRLDQYEPGRDFGAWIKAIARNRVRQELRARSRARQHLARYQERVLERLENEMLASRHEESLREAVARCREQMPRHASEILDLRYVKRLSFREIAAAQNATAAGVEKMLSRIRLALRDCVQRRLQTT
jgi:RNA polymerase sigma-70 factor (ECF subfamily)